MKYAIRPLEEGDINDIVSGETRIFGYSLGYDMIYAELKINPYAHYFVLEIDGGFGEYIGLWIYEESAEIINFCRGRIPRVGFRQTPYGICH